MIIDCRHWSGKRWSGREQRYVCDHCRTDNEWRCFTVPRTFTAASMLALIDTDLNMPTFWVLAGESPPVWHVIDPKTYGVSGDKVT